MSPAQREELLDAIRRRRCRNINFGELRALVEAFGYVHSRTKGSHFTFKHPDHALIITIPYSRSEVSIGVCRAVLRTIGEIIALEEGEDSYGQ